jgi:hypothetical protein
VHAEDFTVIIDGEGLSELNVTGLVSVTRDSVSATFGQGVVLVVDDLQVEVVGEMKLDQTLILGISDSTSIVSFRHHIVEGFIRHRWEFVQEEHELLLGDTEIRHSERVLDIPSEGSELSTLKDKGVEEAETVEQAFESLGLLALVELFVGDVILVGTDQIVSHSIWRLKGGLDGVLHDSHRELIGGQGSQPETEATVFIVLGVIDNTIENRHKGRSQMAILEHDPSAVDLGLLDSLNSDSTLTTTKRKGVHFLLELGLNFHDINHGISTSREHDDDGSVVSRVLHNLSHIEGWRNNVVLAHFFLFRNEFLDHEDNLIGSEETHDNRLVEDG